MQRARSLQAVMCHERIHPLRTHRHRDPGECKTRCGHTAKADAPREPAAELNRSALTPRGGLDGRCSSSCARPVRDPDRDSERYTEIPLDQMSREQRNKMETDETLAAPGISTWLPSSPPRGRSNAGDNDRGTLRQRGPVDDRRPGRAELRDFYANHFQNQIPPDMEMVTVSRTIGQGRVATAPGCKIEGVCSMPATTGMKGAGYYDRHSGAQASSIQALQGWVDEGVATLPRPTPGQPVTVLDLRLRGGGRRRPPHGGRRRGAAGAHRRARAGGLQRPARQRLQPAVRDLEEARGTGLIDAGVYPAAVAGSFYGPLLPPGTVHLATCFNAIHWLDRLPAVPMPDAIVYRRRPGRGRPCRRRFPWRSHSRRSRTWCGSWSAGPGNCCREASCCWLAQATPTGPASPTESRSSSTTPAWTWSPPGG